MLAAIRIATPILACVLAAAAAEAQEPSRFAQACEKAARAALVSSFTFEVTEILDQTPAEPAVVVGYNATSRNSGKVYPTVFTCVFRDTADPGNIVLEQALEGQRPFGIQAVNALNHMLEEEGFAPKRQ